MIKLLEQWWTEKRRLRERLARAADTIKALNERLDVRDENNRGLAAELNQLRSARNVAWPRPARRMPAIEVKRAFAVEPTAPLWMALNQVLDDKIVELVDDLSLPPGATMTEAQRLHLAGGVEELRKFAQALLEMHAAAMKTDGDLEDGKKAA